jgi:putative membrane protein
MKKKETKQEKKKTSIKDIFLSVFGGFTMALADSVPGVSGGTIAFILGIFDQFITSIDDLLRGDMKKKKAALPFLLRLGLGWVVGLGIASTVLSTLFKEKVYPMSSLFIGFIIFALPLVIKEEKEALKKNYKNIVFAILGIIVVSLITYFSNGSLANIDFEHLNVLTILLVFLSGAIAITAMVLPGISGSTFLLVFGLYTTIITAVKDLFHMNFSVIPLLAIFGFGILFGMFFFFKLIRKGLENHRGAMVYFVLGMMLASIYAIIMAPTTIEGGFEMLTFSNFNIYTFIAGGAIILGLDYIKKLLSKNE